jgi:muramidase (phage lysozyme)
MSTSSAAMVGYNSSDPYQTGFLAAIATGETGAASGNTMTGYGGANLAGDPTDQYGFPSWTGMGNTHAAGTYQFQPGTWDTIASKYGLNFGNASDQSAGAWYLAQQQYSAATGGQSLETALQQGNYSSIQSALGSTWTSVKGNANLPQGLATALGSFISNATSASPAGGATGAATGAASAGTAGGSAPPATGGGPVGPPPSGSGSGGGLVSWALGGLSDIFARGGLIVLGVVVIAIALYALLVQQGYAPSPKQIAKNL